MSKVQQDSGTRERLAVGMILTGTSTGPHRLQLPESVVADYLLTHRPRAPRTLPIAGVLLMVACCAGAIYLVSSKRSSATIGQPALQAYRQAEQLFAAGKRYEAQEQLKRVPLLTGDSEILGLAGALERRLDATLEMDQAQIQIRASKWKEAVFHLQKVLALHPTPEAIRLLAQANAALSAARPRGLRLTSTSAAP